MDKSLIIASSVVKNTVHTTNYPPIAAGKRLVVVRIGMTDESKGDKPSVVRLKFGGELIRTLCATTDTVEIGIGKEFLGDGVKFLSVERENAENSDKPITVWVDAYDK